MTTARPHKIVGLWLVLVTFMLFAMVMLGGLTRLTESGLSIVEWKPISGVVPPLNDADWNAAFDAYKATPQFRQINHAMTLDEFKNIFWVEYIHRLVGRIIGFILFIPLFYFWLSGKMSGRLTLKCLGLGLLGGIQGVIGWYMVKSGLVDRPWVNHLRLSFHLTFAAIIILCTLWITLQQILPNKLGYADTHKLSRMGWALVGLILLQIASGGLVAGLHAGFVLPAIVQGGWGNLWQAALGWRNFIDNPITVLFLHISLAFVVLAATSAFCLHCAALRRGTTTAMALMGMAFSQVLLGFVTVLSFPRGLPIVLANIHQGFGFLLLMTALLHVYCIRPSARAQSS